MDKTKSLKKTKKGGKFVKENFRYLFRSSFISFRIRSAEVVDSPISFFNSSICLLYSSNEVQISCFCKKKILGQNLFQRK